MLSYWLQTTIHCVYHSRWLASLWIAKLLCSYYWSYNWNFYSQFFFVMIYSIFILICSWKQFSRLNAVCVLDINVFNSNSHIFQFILIRFNVRVSFLNYFNFKEAMIKQTDKFAEESIILIQHREFGKF